MEDDVEEVVKRTFVFVDVSSVVQRSYRFVQIIVGDKVGSTFLFEDHEKALGFLVGGPGFSTAIIS